MEDESRQMRQFTLSEINKIINATGHGEDTLQSFKDKYDGKFLRFTDANEPSRSIKINLIDEEVMATIEGFPPLTISKFENITKTPNVVIETHE